MNTETLDGVENACSSPTGCAKREITGSDRQSTAVAPSVANSSASLPIKTWGGARAGSGRPCNPPDPVIPVRLLGPRWYVVQLRPGLEHRAVRDMVLGEDRWGYIPRPSYYVEMPMQAVERTYRGKPVFKHTPMFLGYAFVRMDLATDAWAALLYCEGVSAVMTNSSGRPTPIRENGLVERLIAEAPERLRLDAKRMRPREVGAILTVSDGVLMSLAAVCVECDGLTTTATVEVFGRAVPVTMPWSSFTAAT